MNAFCINHIVRFSEIDAAGIVFYPRYIEMISASIEDWFAGPLGISFKQMHLDGDAGIPIVDLHCRFFAPSRLGDDLTFEIKVSKIGRSSVDLEIDVRCDDEMRFETRLTFVHAKRHGSEWKSEPLPDDLREKMSQFLTSKTQMEEGK